MFIVTVSSSLIVFSAAVPEPTVSPSCDDEKTNCTLTCEGSTTGAEPVTYTWKSDDTVITTSTQKQHNIEVLSTAECNDVILVSTLPFLTIIYIFLFISLASEVFIDMLIV